MLRHDMPKGIIVQWIYKPVTRKQVVSVDQHLIRIRALCSEEKIVFAWKVQTHCRLSSFHKSQM